ncbi:SDR family NAD(P)-dependent oxidoreductase [Terracidiphilus sp.]|jgi:NAD(P)-dependent dehydrogenase (short-subunit alcohol dehydrogenase family)|uniref:SDR family NAD(P)-dependent oxidoreductase n=1 Tax=Terracidiphilus sp. TaxID=1964191 RepID=UPI003C26CC6E
MSRIFITGSSDGLGLMAAQLLVAQGHTVVLHARSEERAAETHRKLPEAEAVVVGDLSSLRQMHSVAEQANALGTFDAIIHNAAVGYQEPRRVNTADGFAHVFAINSLAPYVLTALISPPKRLVYISSGLHKDGDPSLRDLNWENRAWNGLQAYSDSKLHNLLLAFAMARQYPDVLCNAMTPGWVATKMGGPGANDDLKQAHRTQAWLAVSDDPAVRVSGKYFYHLQSEPALAAALDHSLQDSFMNACEQLTGMAMK